MKGRPPGAYQPYKYQSKTDIHEVNKLRIQTLFKSKYQDLVPVHLHVKLCGKN